MNNALTVIPHDGITNLGHGRIEDSGLEILLGFKKDPQPSIQWHNKHFDEVKSCIYEAAVTTYNEIQACKNKSELEELFHRLRALAKVNLRMNHYFFDSNRHQLKTTRLDRLFETGEFAMLEYLTPANEWIEFIKSEPIGLNLQRDLWYDEKGFEEFLKFTPAEDFALSDFKAKFFNSIVGIRYQKSITFNSNGHDYDGAHSLLIDPSMPTCLWQPSGERFRRGEDKPIPQNPEHRQMLARANEAPFALNEIREKFGLFTSQPTMEPEQVGKLTAERVFS